MRLPYLIVTGTHSWEALLSEHERWDGRESVSNADPSQIPGLISEATGES